MVLTLVVLILMVLILMVLFHGCPFNGDRRKTPPYINAHKGQKCALRNIDSERTFMAEVIVLFKTTNNQHKKLRSPHEQVIINTQPSTAHS